MNENRKQVLRGCICAASGGVIWGFSGTCGQYLFAHWPISSLWLTCIRMMGGGLIFLLLALIKDRREVAELLRSHKDLAQTLIDLGAEKGATDDRTALVVRLVRRSSAQALG